MSLASILAEHSRDISASINHTQEMAQENVDRKANTLEDKFQHIKDGIESAGGEVAALGGAWHMGRKVYNKFKERQSQASKARETRGQNEDTNSSQAQNDADADGVSEKPTGSSESGGTQSSASGEAPEGTSSGGAEAAPDPKPSNPVKNDAEGGTETQPASEQPVAGETKTIVSEGGEARDATLRPQEADAEFGDFQPQQARALQQSVHQTPPEQTANDGQVAKPSAEGESSSAGDVKATEVDGVKINPQSGSGADGAVSQEAGDVGTSDSLMGDVGDNVATKVGSKLASAGGDAVSGAMETAGSVLDWLGPIGEVAGIITGLVGLFEGIGHKKKVVSDTGEQASADASVDAGVDTEALTREQAPTPVGVMA